jgi:DNA-binding Lrp family transcriptional regulator
MDDLKGKILDYLAKGGRVTVGRPRKALGSHTFISRATVWSRGRKANNLRLQGIYASTGGS